MRGFARSRKTASAMFSRMCGTFGAFKAPKVLQRINKFAERRPLAFSLVITTLKVRRTRSPPPPRRAALGAWIWARRFGGSPARAACRCVPVPASPTCARPPWVLPITGGSPALCTPVAKHRCCSSWTAAPPPFVPTARRVPPRLTTTHIHTHTHTHTRAHTRRAARTRCTQSAAADVMVQKCVEDAEVLDVKRTALFGLFGFTYQGGFQYWLINGVFERLAPGLAWRVRPTHPPVRRSTAAPAHQRTAAPPHLARLFSTRRSRWNSDSALPHSKVVRLSRARMCAHARPHPAHDSRPNATRTPTHPHGHAPASACPTAAAAATHYLRHYPRPTATVTLQAIAIKVAGMNFISDPIFFFPTFYTMREAMATERLDFDTVATAMGKCVHHTPAVPRRSDSQPKRSTCTAQPM